jgi:16S rRNA (uracil1498-N3)-methyltransferase
MDLILQKAAELGAARVVPMLSDRTVSQWDDSGATHKAAKWRTIVVEAAKQCGSPWLPRIDPLVSVPVFLAKNEPFDLTLVASLQPGAQHPRHYFHQLRHDPRPMPKSVAVWVGPEGDFTPAELNLIRASGALPITLGPLVLRAETAAIYCLSVLNYETQTGAATDA